MKKLIALVLACLMVLGGSCLAAQWPEGRSAAQPYSHLPEVNLSETMGYIMLFPRAKLPANRFCNVLDMFLPREDLKLNEGLVHLYEKLPDAEEPVEVCTVDFSNPDSVSLRRLSDGELDQMMWGGGTCVEMVLPRSLEFGDRDHEYFVLMDEGCFTAADGKLNSLQITNDDAWMPVIRGDYGVSGMYYLDAPLPEAEADAQSEDEDDGDGEIILIDDDDEAEEEEEEEFGIIDVVMEPEEEAEDEEEEADVKATDTPKPTDTPEPTDAPTEEPGEEAPVDPSQYVVSPDAGDKLHFDLVIGGNATLAVVYSDNGSVEFDQIEYAESTHVVGTVVGEDVRWGVAFYDANQAIFDTVDVGR